ncbi:hypothetical protein [Mesorhizobium caraganae]|uniref:hypothetical protein n=1 Tax=Mesorhizobium caraganae TaxID=483206 RepID=UPI003F500ED6
MASRYNLIDHNTTIATTTPTKQNATQTPAMDGLLSQAGIVVPDGVQESLVHAAGFFLDLNAGDADRFGIGEQLLSELDNGDDVGAGGLGDVGRNPLLQKVGAAGARPGLSGATLLGSADELPPRQNDVRTLPERSGNAAARVTNDAAIIC